VRRNKVFETKKKKKGKRDEGGNFNKKGKKATTRSHRDGVRPRRGKITKRKKRLHLRRRFYLAGKGGGISVPEYLRMKKKGGGKIQLKGEKPTKKRGGAKRHPGAGEKSLLNMQLEKHGLSGRQKQEAKKIGEVVRKKKTK